MKIKGAVFDIGQTLVYYPVPLNWSALYRPAFENVAEKNRLHITEKEYAHIGAVLTKYNTRIHPREEEVPSGIIFAEILAGTGIPPEYLDAIRRDFYSFFRNEARIYDEVPETLRAMKAAGILTGTLSDVAYGMDNIYALEDIAGIAEYIDIPLTSNDTGLRKPNPRGLEMFAERTQIRTSEIMFIGDEKKDIECAAGAGAAAVLINRSGEEKDFGQNYTVRNLRELLQIIR